MPHAQQKSLPASLEYLVRKIRESLELNPVRIKKMVAEAHVSQEDLLDWADFDHPVADSYGRTLVFDGGFFEIMVMSWVPGDFSAIHDHGYTQWGAVQVFGPAEHAVFSVDAEEVSLVNRTRLSAGRILAVSHELVHQMGNPGNERFLSLHVYGNYDRSAGVTSDARVFDLTQPEIQRTDGGVFYSLDEQAIKRREPCPPGDYYVWLFDLVQRVLRDRRRGADVMQLMRGMTEIDRWSLLREALESRIDEQGHTTDSRYWSLLMDTLRQAGGLQDELLNGAATQARGADEHWRTYARLYDRVIGTTNSYIPAYLAHVFAHYQLDTGSLRFIDVGCGTGWLESEMLRRFGMRREQLLGVDPSPAMVEVARERTNVRQIGLLELDEQLGQFDVAFCNSFQYLDHEHFDEAMRRMTTITKPGGLCVSEFITQDHIRWYPNVVWSEDGMVVSLRTPSLHERDGYTYQQSEIINVNRLDDVRITYEGIHRRFMVSPRRVYEAFRQEFGPEMEVFDAHTFEPIPLTNETCHSTRYLICARRSV